MAYYPGQKVSHKSPRRITIAKVLIVVAVVAVTYVALTLFPPWWRYYRSSSLMTEEAQKAYSKRREQQSWAKTQSIVHAQVRAELLALLKIPGEDLRVEVKKKDGNIHVSASWKAVARWPLLGRTTTLRYEEEIHFAAR